MIIAILRAQLLSLRALGFRRRSGTWLLSLLPGLAYFLLWSFFAVAAYFVFSSLTDLTTLQSALSGTLLGVFLYWQIAPVITASMGASLDLQKLIVYPIALDKLFFVEVLLRFLTVGEMLLILIGASAGVVANSSVGGLAAVPRILIALPLFIAFNLIVAAGVRSLIERGFRQKRTREVSMLIFVLICALPGVLTAFKAPVGRLVPYLPLTGFWPWVAAEKVIIGRGLSGDQFLLALTTPLIWIALAWRFGRRQFYRTLRSDPNAGRAVSTPRRTRGWADAFFRLPSRIWPDPLGALVEKELRSLSRCAGFRLAFAMGFTFGLVIMAPAAFAGKNGPGSSFLHDHYIAWVSMYSLLLVGFYSFWNAFGYDRSAAQFYFSAPISFRRVLAAKNISAAILQFLEVCLIVLISLVLPLPFRWFAIVEAFAVTGTACLYLFALGNFTSVRYPSALDPDKMSRGAASRGKNVLAMLFLPVAFLPIGLAYWGRAVFHSELIFFALLAVAAIIGGILYWIATDSALQITLSRREDMINALSRGQGPLTTG